MHAAAVGPATLHLQGEANELRKQLSLARSLRSGSSPEFDEKMTRMKQLREMRKGYLDKIQGVCAEAALACGSTFAQGHGSPGRRDGQWGWLRTPASTPLTHVG